MAFEMDWSPDYCLSCDRQTTSGAPYCSQSCRLADLESKSSPTSPTLLDGSRSNMQFSPSPLELSSGFQLPVAYNFTLHKNAASAARAKPSPTTKTSVFSSATTVTAPTTTRGLVSSGSRTSLSSLRSSSSTESFTLSDKARSELRDYASAFDQVRNWKRRINHS